jgi:hypothetical protein
VTDGIMKTKGDIKSNGEKQWGNEYKGKKQCIK